MRIYHHWEKWECVKAGFYDTASPVDDPLEAYAEFLRDVPLFESVLERVITEWPVSCEQFLSNENINRIAWLGQASMCLYAGVPACYRGGFKLLTGKEQNKANLAAYKWLRIWQSRRSEANLELDTVKPTKSKRRYPNTVRGRIERYIASWNNKGYPQGIPDEVPDGIMKGLLAPSYKAVAIAILKNDLLFRSLGFSAPRSKWYGAFKRIELADRPSAQLELF